MLQEICNLNSKNKKMCHVTGKGCLFKGIFLHFKRESEQIVYFQTLDHYFAVNDGEQRERQTPWMIRFNYTEWGHSLDHLSFLDTFSYFPASLSWLPLGHFSHHPSLSQEEVTSNRFILSAPLPHSLSLISPCSCHYIPWEWMTSTVSITVFVLPLSPCSILPQTHNTVTLLSNPWCHSLLYFLLPAASFSISNIWSQLRL